MVASHHRLHSQAPWVGHSCIIATRYSRVALIQNYNEENLIQLCTYKFYSRPLQNVSRPLWESRLRLKTTELDESREKYLKNGQI